MNRVSQQRLIQQFARSVKPSGANFRRRRLHQPVRRGLLHELETESYTRRRPVTTPP